MQGPSTVENASPTATGAGSNGATPAAAHSATDVPRTDFSQHSHQELIAMLAAADPASAHRTAGNWEHTAAMMSEQATALDGELSGFADNWQGDAASSYQVMIKDLAHGVRQVADHARKMRDLSAHAADALDTARATMPAPVDVPSLSPEMMAMASTPIAADPTASPSTLLAAQQQQGQAVAAVQAQQAAQGAANAAHAQAVQVMTTLANSYTDSAASIPASPYNADGSTQGLAGGTGGGGFAPLGGGTPLFGNGSGSDGGTGSIGDLVDPVTGELVAGAEGVASNVPLFGSMFTAGLAAASAAAVGRFGSLLPKLPSFLTRRTGPQLEGSGSLFDPLTGRPLNPYETVPLAGTDPTKALAGAGLGAGGAGGGAGGGGGGMPSMGGFGGGGLGGIGGGAIAGGIGAAAPSAYTALAGSAAGAAGLPAAAGVSGLSAGASGVAAGVGGATGAAGGMPMGMMPMGAGMGGGGMDGARRSPAWLVETDDVWGEQSVVAPSVVGDDAPPPDPRPWVGR